VVKRDLSWLDEDLEIYVGLHRISSSRLFAHGGQRAWWDVQTQLYHVIRYSVPLLEFAAAHSRSLGPDYAGFAEWCERHALEEAHHDEWLLEDLGVGGLDTAQIAASLPSPEVLNLVGNQYALIPCGEPAALLGYLYLAEAHPSTAEELELTAARFGIPEASLRTLLLHTHDDQAHGDEVRSLIERYSDTVRRRDAIRTAGAAYLIGWSSYFTRAARAISVARTA
jgi:hypothetical protein